MPSAKRAKDAVPELGSECDEICMRALTEGDLDAAHGLSVSIGWPHRRSDWAAVLAVGHGYGAHDGIGRLVGTAMWWLIGTTMAMIGMVIVAPGLQGRGVGRRLMQAVLTATQGRALKLNSTAAGLDLYRSLRFRPIGAIEQHQGVARAARRRMATTVKLRAFSPADWPAVAELDRVAHGVDRGHILKALLGHATGLLVERDGSLSGFAHCRPFGRGHVIGPIIAVDEGAAIALTSAILAAHAGQFLRVDVPEGMHGFRRFLESWGLLPTGGATIMIKGREPSRTGKAHIFGLINQAIG